ncbi:MAG: hypothetical protein EZS28_009655 [Streblomastix strix]|uniref:Uncharacterized protein n=1 Tax=Streblomastix strix TaxID=222440 RepID=A0A5J4WJY0_9EUKA|nr:MAG: hypothetical protein EZS28_009655 [Streblomastix strix]
MRQIAAHIVVKNYDNNSVVCAGGGVKARSDINANYYTKTDTDALLDNKLNVSDQIYAYNKQEDDVLLLLKADKTELNDYVYLITAQTINANKTFNNACRFISTLDGMASITGSSIIQSGADDYQPYPEPTDDDYITLGAVKGEFVSTIQCGSINDSLTANQFIKSGGTNQEVLLANGTTKALSEFTGGRDVRDNTGSLGQQFILRNGQLTQSIDGKLTQQLDDYKSYEAIDDDQYITKGSALDGLVQLDGQTVIVGTSKRSDIPESEIASLDYPTAHYVNNRAMAYPNNIQALGTHIVISAFWTT